MVKPPSGTGWVHEIKIDGWRIQVPVEDGKAKDDWTSRFKHITEAAGARSRKFSRCGSADTRSKGNSEVPRTLRSRLHSGVEPSFRRWTT